MFYLIAMAGFSDRDPMNNIIDFYALTSAKKFLNKNKIKFGYDSSRLFWPVGNSLQLV